MKKLLLLQFRTDESAAQEQASFEREALADGTFTITTVNAYTSEQPWGNPEEILAPFAGVIIGGSGEFHFTGHNDTKKETIFSKMIQNVSPLMQYIVTHDFPTLGVCFGHQMIANFLGVQIVEDETQAKAGSYELCLCDEAKLDPVFSEIPDSFVAQYGHKDSLSSLPKDTTLLASGSKCKYGAFRYKKNIYGVQFHPEMNRDDVFEKMRLYPEYTKNDPKFAENAKPSPHAPYVIRNFARTARKK